jgi:hypothetical protein
MENFNLEEAKAGKAICTENGKNARILSTDLKDVKYPVVVAVEDTPNHESVYCYDVLGNVDETFDNNELKLRMANMVWVNVYNGFNCDGKFYPSKEEAEKYRKEGFRTVRCKLEED